LKTVSATPLRARERGGAYAIVLTTAIVVLTLATAYIHSTLGGILFTLNALGYVALAVAIVIGATVTIPFVVRFSWLPRVGLFAYTLATIFGWLMMGPRYDMAYLAKAIEGVLLALLVIDMYRVYGGPGNMLAEARTSVTEFFGSLRR
jgi:hypothetical protein